ncbi:hypothetical protein [Pseudorhodoferax sp.]|uniref:hypothetical protein n=1 Tax=Pseudorhodoferax sp. TaxID=1993553 RepID=UPI002DD64D70|nr:hypothetical protein [Pseudorhodoferax sp.]
MPAVRTVQLVVEVDGLLLRFGRLVPDALALLHVLTEIGRQAPSSQPRLALALARFGRAAPPDWQGLGLDDELRGLGAAMRMLDDGGGLAGGQEPSTGVLLLAGSERQARAAIEAGIPAYRISDRPAAVHWQLALRDVPRVVREALRMPVPRALPDALRRGTLVAVPEGGASAGRARAAQVLRQDLRADWFTLGDTQVFHVEAASALDVLLALPQARALAEGIAPDALGVASDGGGAGTLFARGAHALVAPARAGDLAWAQVRRARLGAAPASAAAAPLPGSGPQALDGCLWLGFGTTAADRVLVVTWEEPQAHAAATAWAEHLRQLLGGDAVLLGAAQPQPLALLWQAERNQLRAVVHLRMQGAVAVDWSEDPGLPAVPVLTVSGLGAAPNGDGRMEALAQRLLTRSDLRA